MKKECKVCNGTGVWEGYEEIEICPKCHGYGFIIRK